jgi:phytoene dehydrogenase-like protein
MVSPLDGGDYLLLADSVERTQANFARFNRKDAEVYAEFDRFLTENAEVFRKLLWETPFDPTARDWKTAKQVFGFATRNRRYANRFFRVYDMLTMSAYDFLKEWFEDERIMAVLAYYASIGTFAGPKTPGSAYVIMHHVMGENAGAGGWGFVRGGQGAISASIAGAATEKGAEILTDAAVKEVRIVDGRARGVTTTDGRTFDAPIVISNAHPKLLYLDMVGEKHLPAEVIRDVKRFRTFSTAFKANLACERPPQYLCLEKARADGALGNVGYPSYVHLAPDIDYLEKAYDEAKHGWYSSEPFVSPLVPTTVDDTLAPPGKHVVNLFGGHAPYALKGGDWAVEKDRFEQNVLNVVDRFAPGFSSDIIDGQFLIAQDIERIVALPQGHIFQGELSADQLFFKRPTPHFADYRTPVAGLYLCGAATHPGGGVSGINGYNAAREVLKDKGTKNGMGYAWQG